jgi:hypothetical protein
MSAAAAEPVAETAKLCDLLGITPKETTELKKVGAILPAAGRGRWLLRSSVQAYTAHLRRLVELKSNDAASLNKELLAKKIIKTAAEGSLAEIKLEIERKNQISARQVFEDGVRIGQILTARVEGFVAEAAGACAGLDERSLQRELHSRTQMLLEEFKTAVAGVAVDSTTEM